MQFCIARHTLCRGGFRRICALAGRFFPAVFFRGAYGHSFVHFGHVQAPGAGCNFALRGMLCAEAASAAYAPRRVGFFPPFSLGGAYGPFFCSLWRMSKRQAQYAILHCAVCSVPRRLPPHMRPGGSVFSRRFLCVLLKGAVHGLSLALGVLALCQAYAFKISDRLD